MSKSGIAVLSVATISDPVAVQLVIVKDQAGNVVKPGQPATATPEPKKDSDGNIGVIIGGVLGGIALLIVIGLVVRYALVMRSKAAA